MNDKKENTTAVEAPVGPKDKDLAVAALQIMQRASLQGSEVDGYAVVRKWLSDIANEQLVVNKV